MAPPKQSLLRSSVLLSLCSIGASLLGMLSQMVQAQRFGAHREMGAYFAALSVTGVVMGMAPAVFSSAIVPALVGLERDPAEQQRAAGTLFRAIAVGACLIALAGAAASPWIIGALLAGASTNVTGLATNLSRLLWAAVGFSIVASYLAAVHQAYKRFARVSSVGFLPPAGIILSVWLTSQYWGVLSVPLGLLAAAAVQVGMLLPNSHWRSGWGQDSRFFSPVVRLFLRLTPAILLSLLPFTIAPMIAVYWAERVDPSAIPYFGYCQSIATVLSVTISFGLATASFPDLVRILSSGDFERFLRDGRRYLKCLFVGAALVATGVGVCRVPALSLLLERGQFDQRALAGTAAVLPWYLAAMVCVAGLNFLRNVYFAAGRHGKLALIGAAVPVAFFGSAAVLSRTHGVSGIAASYALGFFLYAALAVGLLRFNSTALWTPNLATALAGCLAVCLVAVCAARLVDFELLEAPFWRRNSLTALTAFCALCIPAPWLFSREERRALSNSPLFRWLPQPGGACSKTS